MSLAEAEEYEWYQQDLDTLNKVLGRLPQVMEKYSQCSMYDRIAKNKEYESLVSEMQDYLCSNYQEWVAVVKENPACRRDTKHNPLPLNLKTKRF